MTYPKRLIEVDLPIARISAHARREKSIRHGHISTLHIWWARRPLAACRAVICAALWPDPGDPLCPQAFRDAAVQQLVAFAKRVYAERISDEERTLQSTASPESLARWKAIAEKSLTLDPTSEVDWPIVRFALLDFIADFANWDNSTVPAYLETSRALTQAAHEALGGEPGTRPLVVDPFAGGGSIPLEALRVGADAFASDLNPVAVLLNKVVLEYIPKYGQKLADEVRKWGAWIKEQAEKELGEFYPKDPDGATPIAYLWARTIRCEGTGCGAEVPLMRSLWLAKKANRSVALKIVPKPKAKRVDFEIIHDAKAKEVGEGTVKRGSATCPCCGYTTPVKSIREQLKKRRGGSTDARLFCVVTTKQTVQGRFYRLPTEADDMVTRRAMEELERRKRAHKGTASLVPDETIDTNEIRRVSIPMYGMTQWGDLFTPRQALTLSVLTGLVAEIAQNRISKHDNLKEAICTCLAIIVDRCADKLATAVIWHTGREFVDHVFARQAIPISWAFAEANLFSDVGWSGATDWVCKVIESNLVAGFAVGHVEQASSESIPLPDDAVSAVITDPPYYYSVPYSHLSDYFYVWLRRMLSTVHPVLFQTELAPKDEECVQNLPHSEHAGLQKDRRFYETKIRDCLAEAARIIKHDGIATVVFAHSDTAAWEALVAGLISAGWCTTASWPIDTEMTTRLLAKRQSTLSSSVHLVCRPRTSSDIGDWRDVLSALPQRMHEWMPRLASEGVVGADAIFACLGPALEIFSRYARVEKANGDPVLLKEYLEHVWAAVSKEALSVIFRDADASGLEPDARLTAIWLWTVGGGKTVTAVGTENAEEEENEGDEDSCPRSSASSAVRGFTLEFDAARKIAQGLGIHLEKSESIVEVKGDKARLLAVAERTKHLFGKDTEAGPTGGKKAKKKPVQRSMFEELDEVESGDGGWKDLKGPPPGTTILDRLHQAMILFGAQRGELLKRFLIEDGVGKDARFWKLAQSLAALYPPGTDERRWVEGVLARKKGLGL
jgi:putative DNA methylase